MFVVLRGVQRSLTGKHCLFLQCVRCGSHYQTLGVERTASQEEIRTAFLELSKQLHPDTNTDDPTNHDKFVKLNEAYTVLSKSTTRREYDLELDLGFKPMPRAPGGQNRPPSYSETSGTYYYHPDMEQRHHFRDDLMWQKNPNKKRYKIPWKVHVFGLLFILGYGVGFGHLNEQINDRFEKEREYWRQYAESQGVRTEPRSSDRWFRSRGAALFLCAVLYFMGSLMGLYIYFRSRKNTEEIRKQSLAYAMEVRERRKSGRYVGEFDEKFEKMYEKDLDAKEKQNAASSR